MTTPTANTGSMAEDISVRDNTAPAIMVLNAISQFVKDEEFVAKFGGRGPVVSVEMFVNGHAVPVVKTLTEIWERQSALLDKQAEEKAVAMVTEAGLQPLADALREAEWKIREKLGAFHGC